MEAPGNINQQARFRILWMRVKSIENLESPLIAPVSLTKPLARLFNIVVGFHEPLDHHTPLNLGVDENARKRFFHQIVNVHSATLDEKRNKKRFTMDAFRLLQEGAYALAEYALAKDERANINVSILSLCAYSFSVCIFFFRISLCVYSYSEFLTEEARRTILGSKSLQNCVPSRCIQISMEHCHPACMFVNAT